jgi:hypothetical protein
MHRTLLVIIIAAEMASAGRLCAVAAGLLSICSGQQFPSWTGPVLDPLLPYGGIPLAANATISPVYIASPAIGTFNSNPSLDFHDGQFLVTWMMKNSTTSGEGQTIMYSQSRDGKNWTATDGTNVLFPPLSIPAGPVPVYPAPALHINGSVYAAASIIFTLNLYPAQNPEYLILRRVYTPALNKFGPIFWSTNTYPPGFNAADGILLLNETDSETQTDIATLSDWTKLPCPGTTEGSLKCEACLNGCQPWPSQFNGTMSRSHYNVPGGASDVILYKGGANELSLYASVRTGDNAWNGPQSINIPNEAPIDAGVLADGRIFLTSNAMMSLIHDPLFVTTSKDGVSFGSVTALVSCNLPVFTSPTQPFGCIPRYNFGHKEPGAQVPQSVVVTEAGFAGFWTAFAVNLEDIWVVMVPPASLA